MDDKKLTGWLYLVSIVWYIIGITRLTRAGLAAGLVWLCLGSAFFCFASARANQVQKTEESEDKEEKVNETTL